MPKRKLAAIMFTDIVGYTKLMGSDEQEAVELLKQNRAIHKKFIKQYGGELLKEIGDGMLASFSTTSDAVYCAGSIQKDSKQVDGLELRIGIHQGEVLVESEDILGDGVNVASRIEGLAQPNEILVSEPVYNNVKNRLGVTGELYGEHELKNVDRPVKVYSVKVDQFPKTVNAQKPKFRKGIVIGGVAVLLLAIFFIVNPFQGGSTQASDNGVVDIDKSIAVLPFINDSADPDNEYFCNGMMETILNYLSKVGGLKTTSRTSTMKYQRSNKTIPEIGEELNVEYILEGSVQKYQNDIRFTVQLIDVKADNHLWSDYYDGKFTQDLLVFQTKVAKQVVKELDITLSPAEDKLLSHVSTNNIEAYDLFVKALYEHSQYWRNYKKDHLQKANAFLLKALQLDPTFLEALSLICGIKNASGDLDSALVFANKIISFYPKYEGGYRELASSYMFMNNFDLAIDNFKKALQVTNQKVPYHYEGLGRSYLHNGDLINAFDNFLIAMDLKKGASGIAIMDLGILYLSLGDFEKSLKFFEKSMETYPTCYVSKYQWWLLTVQNKFLEAMEYTKFMCEDLGCEETCNSLWFRSYLLQENFEKAEQYFIRWKKGANKQLTDAHILNYELAYIYYHLGRYKEAETIFNEQIQILKFEVEWKRENYIHLARIHAFRGETTKALDNLSSYYSKKTLKNGWYDFILIDPFFKDLRDNPEFKSIVMKAKTEQAAIRTRIKEIEISSESVLN